MAPEILQTTCCVVGGGPAGMVLGYLLARRGVQVTVLEKHQDFFAIFAAIRCIRLRSRCLRNLGCSRSSWICHMRR